MKKNNQNQPEEEIKNIDQFQISRSNNNAGDKTDEDEEYTANEVEYADGEGTLLNDQLGEIDEVDPDDMDTEDDESDLDVESENDDSEENSKA